MVRFRPVCAVFVPFGRLSGLFVGLFVFLGVGLPGNVGSTSSLRCLLGSLWPVFLGSFTPQRKLTNGAVWSVFGLFVPFSSRSVACLVFSSVSSSSSASVCPETSVQPPPCAVSWALCGPFFCHLKLTSLAKYQPVALLRTVVFVFLNRTLFLI